DVDAVARVEIAQAIAVVARADLEVGARHRLVGEHEVADDRSPAGDARLDDLELLALIGPADHDQLALAQAADGRPLALEQRGQPRAVEARWIHSLFLLGHRGQPTPGPASSATGRASSSLTTSHRCSCRRRAR